ncbi:MAG: hypothetical protein FD126_2908 [Elusimicrobia bacterium]|nr:MAG: hypothetical protein FD126_2908 [Elusimicrobiota bacterium]
MKLEWRQVLPAFVAAFALGAAAGSWAQRMGGPRHRMMPPPPARIVARLDRELGFDDAQRQAVLALLEKRRPEAEALHHDALEKAEVLKRSVQADIRALLRPDQQAKLDEFVKRKDARRGRFRGGH